MTERVGSVLLLGAVLVLASAASAAETYRWIDEQGNVTYSDRPPQSRDVRPRPTAKPALDPKMLLRSKAPEVKAPGRHGCRTRRSPRGASLDEDAAGAQRRATPSDPRRKATIPLPPPKAGLTKVDELLELSGARAQLVGLVARVAADLRPAPGQMSAADLAAVDRILAQSLRHEAVYGAVRDAFLPQVDRPSLEATAAWLRTPVGRKIVALEIAVLPAGRRAKSGRVHGGPQGEPAAGAETRAAPAIGLGHRRKRNVGRSRRGDRARTGDRGVGGRAAGQPAAAGTDRRPSRAGASSDERNPA